MSHSKEIKTVVLTNPEELDQTPFSLLNQELINNEGKVLVGLVHRSLYGPMRGFYAIIKPKDPQMLHKYLNDPTEKVMGYKQEEIIVKFWEKTQLGTNMMVLPIEFIEDHDLQPREFENIIELHKHFMGLCKKAVPISMDPFYYRMGNIR